MDVKRVVNTAAEVPGEDEDSYTREDDSIPLADGDPADFVEDSLVSEDKRKEFEWRKKVDFESLDSIPSMLSDRSDLAFQPGSSGHISDHMNRMSLDPDFSPDEQEEKARLISQVLELQNTLDDLTHRVDKASHVFQAVSPKSRRRHRAGPGSTMGSVIKCTAKAVRGAVGGQETK